MADDQDKRRDLGPDEDETHLLPAADLSDEGTESDEETRLIPTASGGETVVIPSAEPRIDQTRIMEAQTPDPDVWKGRAEVPQPPVRDAVPSESADPAGESGRTWWTPLLLGLLALGLVGLIIVGAWLALRNRQPDPIPTIGVPTRVPATSAMVRPSPVSPTVQLVPAPSLVDQTAVDAATELERLGLVADIREVSSTKPAGTVVRQDPLPGVALPVGSTVTLFVAVAPEPTEAPSPTPPVPSPSPEVSPT